MATTFFTKGNRVYSTLDGSLTDIALSCVVTTATGYNDHPATNHTIQVGDDAQGYEIMTATSSGGANPTLTIVRSREGTGALPFNAGTDVKLVITAAQVVEYETALNLRVEQAASSTDNAIARFDGVDGDLVQNSQTTVDDNGAIKVSGGGASIIAYEAESGGAGNYCAWSLGRAAAELQGAVCHQNDAWFTGSVAGDGAVALLDNTKSLFVGVGAAGPQVEITNTEVLLSGDLTIGDDLFFKNGASLDEDTNELLRLNSANFQIYWDMGAVDGRALYLRNGNAAGTGVYQGFHYYSGAHRQWSIGINGGATNNFVISQTADLSAPKFTLSTAGNATIAGDLTVTGNDINDSGGTAVTFDGSQNTTLAGNLTITNTKTILRGQSIISQAITWDGGATQACATVADGYVVVDVYIEITTTFDGDAVVTVGDGGDPDGFLTDADINQGAAAYYGYDVSARGTYLTGGDRKIYTGADTVDAFVTETTATQGAATVYTVIQRLK